MSLLSELNETTNVLAWVRNCRLRNCNAIQNSHTGAWLGKALEIIERQYNEIQDIRNEEIDRSGTQFLELRDRNEKLERVAKLVEIEVNRFDEAEKFLESSGWKRSEHGGSWNGGSWTHADRFVDIKNVSLFTALDCEMAEALNALQKPGG